MRHEKISLEERYKPSSRTKPAQTPPATPEAAQPYHPESIVCFGQLIRVLIYTLKRYNSNCAQQKSKKVITGTRNLRYAFAVLARLSEGDVIIGRNTLLAAYLKPLCLENAAYFSQNCNAFYTAADLLTLLNQPVQLKQQQLAAFQMQFFQQAPDERMRNQLIEISFLMMTLKRTEPFLLNGGMSSKYLLDLETAIKKSAAFIKNYQYLPSKFIKCIEFLISHPYYTECLYYSQSFGARVAPQAESRYITNPERGMVERAAERQRIELAAALLTIRNSTTASPSTTTTTTSSSQSQQALPAAISAASSEAIALSSPRQSTSQEIDDAIRTPA